MVPLVFQKNKNKKKGKDEKSGSEVTTPENSSSPGMMDMHGEWEVSPADPATLPWKYCLKVKTDTHLVPWTSVDVLTVF